MGVGVKVSTVSCATVRTWFRVTAVPPLPTVPSDGSPVTFTVNAEAALSGSLGAAMPIAVGGAFSATLSDAATGTGGVVSCAVTLVPLLPSFLTMNRVTLPLSSCNCTEPLSPMTVSTSVMELKL